MFFLNIYYKAHRSKFHLEILIDKSYADSEFLVHFSVGLHFGLFWPYGVGPFIGIPMTYNTKFIFVKKFHALFINVCAQIEALLMGFKLKKNFAPPIHTPGINLHLKNYHILVNITNFAQAFPSNGRSCKLISFLKSLCKQLPESVLKCYLHTQRLFQESNKNRLIFRKKWLNWKNAIFEDPLISKNPKIIQNMSFLLLFFRIFFLII